MFEFEIVY